MNIWPFSVINELRRQVAYWKREHDDVRRIAWGLSKFAPKPQCRICGGTELDHDPAGYYEHAQRWDGAPLLCKKCADLYEEKVEAMRRYNKFHAGH